MINEPEFPPLAIETVDSPPGPRYVIRTAADALQPQPPTEYIVDQMIVKRSVNVFYGEPGSKKTYSLLSLAVCVAGGMNWLGYSVNQCKVLIIDEESGETRLSKRLGAALRGEEMDAETPVSYVSLANFKLDNLKDRDDLKSLILSEGAELVIIDALADVMDGDENSKQDIQPVFNSLRKIAEDTGAAIIVIHHSNKAGGYRGSSAIKGAIEIMVLVTSQEESNSITFECEKNRDGNRIKWGAVATWMEWDTPGETFTLRPYAADNKRSYSKGERYVLRYLEDNGDSPLTEIMGAADSCSPNTAKVAVYSLVDKGAIYRTNPEDKGRGTVARYDLKAGYDEL